MIRHIVLAATLMALGGCFYSLLPFSVSMENIPWEGPRELTLAHCPNIDGIYSVVPIGRKDAYLALLYNYKSIFESAGLDRVIDTLPIGSDPLPSVSTPASREEEKKRDREKIIELSIQGNIATKKLSNKSGKMYSIKTVLLDPNIRPDEWRKGEEARVGCHEGKYIYRHVHSFGGFEGSPGSRTWSEYQIEKLPDGNLKIRDFAKELVQGEEPRVVSNYTFIFPAYRP